MAPRRPRRQPQSTSPKAASRFAPSASPATSAACRKTQMQRLLADDTGKVVTLRELHGVADKIERYLQTERQLIVAKAWVPLQDVQHGVVEIRILQGAVGQLRTDSQFLAGAAREGGLATRTGVLPPGAPIMRERLEEAVYRVADYLGMPARALLVPAAEAGRIRRRLRGRPGPTHRASVSVDNTGNRYTSEWHDALSVRVANLSGHADQLAIYAQLLTPNQRNLHMTTSCRSATTCAWAPPRRPAATTCAARSSRSTPAAVPACWRVNLSRAVHRARALNVYLSAELLQRRLSNRKLGVTTSEHEVSELTTRQPRRLGRRRGTQLRLDEPHLGHADVRAAGADALTDPASARLHGRFAQDRLRLQPHPAARQHQRRRCSSWPARPPAKTSTLPKPSCSAGWAPCAPTLPAKRPATKALVAQFEYHQRLRDGLRAFAFYDHGWIELHRNPWPGFTGANRFQLKGAGVGVAWNPGPRVRAVADRRLQGRPQPAGQSAHRQRQRRPLAAATVSGRSPPYDSERSIIMLTTPFRLRPTVCFCLLALPALARGADRADRAADRRQRRQRRRHAAPGRQHLARQPGQRQGDRQLEHLQHRARRRRAVRAAGRQFHHPEPGRERAERHRRQTHQQWPGLPAQSERRAVQPDRPGRRRQPGGGRRCRQRQQLPVGRAADRQQRRGRAMRVR